MTLPDFRIQVTARLPEAASWWFSEQNGLLIAARDQSWVTHDPELGRWSVALDGGTYPLRATSLDDALTRARARWRTTLLAARDLELLPWTTTQAPPAEGETETP